MASKRLALAAAALVLLDYAATTYLDGKFALPLPVIVGVLLS